MVEQTQSKAPNQNQDGKVISVLRSGASFEHYRQILIEAGIDDPNEAPLALLVLRLVQSVISPREFLMDVSREYTIGSAAARQIALTVGEQILLAHASALPFSVVDVIKLWRGEAGQIDAPIPSDFSKEEEEITKIALDKASIIESKGPLDIPGMVKEICENPAFQFKEASLRERCVKLIESRVRDVRTPEQTRAQIEKPIDKGGLGVTGRRLADILALIEGRVSAFQGNLSHEQRQKRIDQRAGLPDKIQLAKNEETLLTKRYVALTGKVPGSHIAPAAPSVSRTSVAISAHHEQLTREGKIDTAKVKEAVEGAKQAATLPRSKSTPSMQEVTFEKRLSGPIEELRSLTLADFRRLSKDPMQGATKIKDKVDLMEEQGYDRLVEAVQAWRSSALNQMYVDLTREAVLTGTSVTELLSRKRAAGEETLSDEELKAVMKLNADLRF